MWKCVRVCAHNNEAMALTPTLRTLRDLSEAKRQSKITFWMQREQFSQNCFLCLMFIGSFDDCFFSSANNLNISLYLSCQRRKWNVLAIQLLELFMYSLFKSTKHLFVLFWPGTFVECLKLFSRHFEKLLFITRLSWLTDTGT